jgi:trimethylamine-N-oxide reductase (cytochrome c)
MAIGAIRFSVLLFGMHKALRLQARRYPAYAKRHAEKNFTAQIRTFDGKTARWFTFRDGKVVSSAGLHPDPTITISIASAELGARLFTPWVGQLERIEAMKNFEFKAEGPEELIVWFTQTLSMMQGAGWEFGTPMPDGTTRLVTNTNGGPLFVYVKDDKIVRMTPIEFGDDDAPTWTITARGKSFTPPRQTSVAPHTMCSKATIYSPDRLLYPMKRVDFDPKGERNELNRGVSGYVRISRETIAYY